MSDEKIDITAKTDRELLIMVADGFNSLYKKVDKLDKAVHGNGTIGIKTQVLILYCAVIALALGGRDFVEAITRVVFQ